MIFIVYNIISMTSTMPTKEEIYQWYIIEDGAYKDAPKHFGISQWCFDNLCRDYNIRKDRHKTCLKSVATRIKDAGGRDEYLKKVTANRDKHLIEKYGSVENFYKLKGQKNKAAWNARHDEILSKVNSKKRQNNSFNTSAGEILLYNYLVDKYGADNIIKEYKDERYPYCCDFYVKSVDLFIELNLHWTHGGHPFDRNNTGDIEMLHRWEERAKTSNFYKNAIETWTVRDVNKITCAKENNLNYKVIYDLKDILGENNG